MYKAIISDVDGTFTEVDPNAKPSLAVVNSIQEILKKGYHFVLASGRPYYMIKPLMDYANLTGPCICDNGAVIFESHTGEVLWESNLRPKDAELILFHIKDIELTRASCDVEIIENPKKIPSHYKIRKISAHDIQIDQADNLIQKIHTATHDVLVFKASSYKGNEYIDLYFSNTSATKQHAIIEVCKLLNIRREETIGVGDGYNDFPLLMACGLKVAMGNAVPELKDIADYIAPSIENDGIVDIIDKFIINSNEK